MPHTNTISLEAAKSSKALCKIGTGNPWSFGGSKVATPLTSKCGMRFFSHVSVPPISLAHTIAKPTLAFWYVSRFSQEEQTGASLQSRHVCFTRAHLPNTEHSKTDLVSLQPHLSEWSNLPRWIHGMGNRCPIVAGASDETISTIFPVHRQ